MELEDLALTPPARAELEAYPDELVQAWLQAVSRSHGIRSPAGFFLAGVRSGNMPGDLADERRSKAVYLAELWLRNVGHVIPSELELERVLFGPRQRLEPWAADDELRRRMLELWRSLRPAPISWPPRQG
jgi:hypothetical protein